MKTLLFFLGLAGLGAWLLPSAGRLVSRRVQKTEDAAINAARHVEQRAGDGLTELSTQLIETLTDTIQHAAGTLPAVSLPQPGAGAPLPGAVAGQPEVRVLHPLYSPWPTPRYCGPFWPAPAAPRLFPQRPRRFRRDR
jgi:hypothetical protein